MQNPSEKKTYVKPEMKVCGSMVEQTLVADCSRLISGQYWCPVELKDS